MKLSSILASGLFFSGIIASPVAASGAAESSAASNSNETMIPSDNSTDVSIEGFKKLCFSHHQKSFCPGRNRSKCIKSHTPEKGPKKAANFCGFWCTKMKNTEDCGFNRQLYNYEPKDWTCKDDMSFDC
ncbi:putative secreted protein [Wickerhamomyces ciferrii]|uniref:Secreted protein n=1 Tax=Wickerhamomyces ciferrii (strain ATCC 14091 / BCRC 22168 / CBS 111 / JCM 3599 / NBRC 0793 / NRRL Y-1031 F-60-10) TaxID=1206466 RepID=K0KWX1_WICCF|nr:uncharacterized protein BN7_6135 [Wickerhamomyces ciferrii]CCH46542.1 putative secreted protein [Wickerhamomyces ciferrii]